MSAKGVGQGLGVPRARDGWEKDGGPMQTFLFDLGRWGISVGRECALQIGRLWRSAVRTVRGRWGEERVEWGGLWGGSLGEQRAP